MRLCIRFYWDAYRLDITTASRKHGIVITWTLAEAAYAKFGGCRCERFDEIKALLDEHGAVQLNAAVIHTGDYTGRRWHVNFKRFIQDK